MTTLVEDGMRDISILNSPTRKNSYLCFLTFQSTKRRKKKVTNSRNDTKVNKLDTSTIGCFQKWRSLLKTSNAQDEPIKQNVIENFDCESINMPKPPPKSLPLTRRVDNMKYRPLVPESMMPFNEFRGSINIPPAIPMRRSNPQVNDINAETFLKIRRRSCRSFVKNRNDIGNNIINNFQQLKKEGWYWGPLTIDEAETLLRSKENGVFLVRDSGHDSFVLSISFRALNNTFHTRVDYSDGKFGVWFYHDQTAMPSSIVQFVQHLMEESHSGNLRYMVNVDEATNLSPLASNSSTHSSTNSSTGSGSSHIAVSLLYPFSRLRHVVFSLKHLSRFVVLCHIRRDHIPFLPLPNKLQNYLAVSQYFIESLEPYIDPPN